MKGLHLWRLEWLCEMRDAWVGLYWSWESVQYGCDDPVCTEELHLYLCLLPFLPIHVVLGRVVTQKERA